MANSCLLLALSVWEARSSNEISSLISPQNPKSKIRNCSTNEPVRIVLHKNIFSNAIICCHALCQRKTGSNSNQNCIFVNFGFQQDNESLTQKHDENKFVLGSAPSKRRTKRTKKPINSNTERTTKSFIVFLASKTQHMILQPALSLLPPGEANSFTLRESGYGACGVPDPSDNSIVLIGGGWPSPHRSVDKSLRCWSRWCL